MAAIKNQDAYNRLKGQLRIDPLTLDDQLSDLPMLCQDVGEFLAEISADLDYETKRADDLAASLNLQFRDEHEIRKEKVTEALIKNEVSNAPDMVKLQNVVLQLKYEKSLWSNLFDSWRAKTSALKYYCQMTVAGYITPNAAYSNVRQEIQEASGVTPRRRAQL